MREYNKENIEIFAYCMISALVIGIITHGMILFNKLSWHDDAGAIEKGVGVTFTSGRWFLDYVGGTVEWFFGSNHSIPILHGVFSFFCIGVVSYLLCRELDVRCKRLQIIVSALLVTFPTVTATFAYMFTSGYYFLSLLMAVSGAVCICHSIDADLIRTIKTGRVKDKAVRIISLFFGILLLGFATGIYQAYFVSGFCMIYLTIIRDAFKEQKSVSGFIFVSVMRGISGGLGLLCYLVLNHTVLKLQGLELSGYEGLNSMNSPSLIKMMGGVAGSVKAFFGVFCGSYMGFYGSRIVRIAAILLMVIFIVEVVGLTYMVKASGIQFPMTVIQRLLVFVCPVVFNAIEIFLSNGTGIVHGLMVYGSIFTFVLPLVMSQWMINGTRGRNRGLFDMALTVTAVLLIISFIHLDNRCYYKAYLYQHQAEQYYNRLITRIEETAEYYPGIKIYFMGNFAEDTFVHYP